MKRLIAGLSLLIFILPQGAWADPSPGIQWLQNEPLTLFDWGIYQIDKSLKEVRQEIQSGDKKITLRKKGLPMSEKGFLEIEFPKYGKWKYDGVDYNFENNFIDIFIFVKLDFYELDGPGKQSILAYEQIIRDCKNALQVIRAKLFANEGVLLYFDEQLISSEKIAEKLFKSWFAHRGFKNSNRPSSLEEELVRNTTVRVLFGDTLTYNYMECKMLLGGGSISLKDKIVKD